MKYLAVLVIAFGLMSTGCPQDQTIKLAKIGESVNFGLNQSLIAVKKSYAAGNISKDQYRTVVKKIDEIQYAADKANALLDKVTVVDVANKGAVVQVLNDLARTVQDALTDDTIVTLDGTSKSTVNKYFTVIGSSLQVAATLVAVIKQPTSKSDISVQVKGLQ